MIKWQDKCNNRMLQTSVFKIFCRSRNLDAPLIKEKQLNGTFGYAKKKDRLYSEMTVFNKKRGN